MVWLDFEVKLDYILTLFGHNCVEIGEGKDKEIILVFSYLWFDVLLEF